MSNKVRPSTIETLEDLENYYWLKTDLQNFCKSNDMSATGSKIEIAERVAVFLKTGEKLKPMGVSSKPVINVEPLSLDTIIPPNHRCSQQVRYFFQSVIPNFHFSTHIQKYFVNNVGKRYSDVVDEWYAEQERKKDPSFKKEIAPQFEYNTFIRDFFADPANQGRGRLSAIEEWNAVKSLPGSNKYKPKN